MFFAFSKIAGFFLMPSNALVIAGAFGFVLLFTRWRTLGRALVGLAFVFLLFFGLGPGANLLIVPLEERFTQPPAGAKPDGIILLGGGVEDLLSDRRGGLQLNEAGDRIIELVALARLHPEATLVFSGGGAGFLQVQRTAEAEVTRRELADLGLTDREIVIESQSRNTAENAIKTAALLKGQEDKAWWLVTSAFHMPRSVGVFRKAGLEVTPYATDYRTGGSDYSKRGFTSVSEGLRRTDLVVREWIGLFVYWITGRTDTFLPGP